MTSMRLNRPLLFLVVLSCSAGLAACGSGTGIQTAEPANQELNGQVLRDVAGAPSGVRLTWPVVEDSLVAGYHVYKDQQAIPDSARGNASMWVTIDGATRIPQPGAAETTVVADDMFPVSIGETWYYRITSVDAGGSESRLSGEISVTIGEFSITSIDPLSAGVNSGVTVNGEHFGIYDVANDGVFYAGVNWVSGIGFQPAPIPAEINSWMPSEIVTRVPLGSTSGNVIVEVGGTSKASTDVFTNSHPYLTSIDRLTGTAGTEVTLTGNNFGDNFDTGHRVVVGTTQLVNPGDYVAYSNTSIVFKIPTVAIGSRRVTVRVGTVDSNSAWLTVQQSVGPIWEHTWGETGTDVATGVIVDSLGDVYLGGYSSSYHGPLFDVLLVKYSSSGGWQWSRVWDNTDQPLIANRNETCEAICIDDLNNLYLTGLVVEPGNQQSVLLQKYDMTGSLLFTRYWISDRKVSCRGMRIASDGSNVYIAGVIDGTGDDLLLLRYDLNGVLIGSSDWSLANDQQPNSIIVDNNGDLIIAGTTLNGIDQVVGSGLDAFVLKVDSDLVLKWAQYWGQMGEDEGHGLYTDSADNVYVVGGSSSWGANLQPTLAVFNSAGSLTESYYLPLTNYSKFLTVGQAANGHFYCVGTGFPQLDVLYVTVMDDADAGFALLDLQGYTHALTMPQALAGCQTSSDDLLICGLAVRRGATWFDQAAVTTQVTGMSVEQTVGPAGISGSAGNLFGTITNVTGIENNGAGGDDALIIKYNPE